MTGYKKEELRTHYKRVLSCGSFLIVIFALIYTTTSASFYSLLLFFVASIFSSWFISYKTMKISIEKERKLRADLLEKEKRLHGWIIRAMGEVIGAIAHQWRQPLNAVGLYIQDVQDSFAHEQLTKEYIDTVTKKAMNQLLFMSRTIDNFRTFFRPSGEKKLLNLDTVVEKILDLFSDQLKHNRVDLDYKKDGDSFGFFGYESELSQAILHIVKNANDAMSENKTVMPLITIRLYKDSQNSVLEIEDNGGGVKNGELERIFEPYFTTKDQGKGIGIGLYMTKVIVENSMGGCVKAENGHKGAKFTIKLPLYTNGTD